MYLNTVEEARVDGEEGAQRVHGLGPVPAPPSRKTHETKRKLTFFLFFFAEMDRDRETHTENESERFDKGKHHKEQSMQLLKNHSFNREQATTPPTQACNLCYRQRGWCCVLCRSVKRKLVAPRPIYFRASVRQPSRKQGIQPASTPTKAPRCRILYFTPPRLPSIHWGSASRLFRCL